MAHDTVNYQVQSGNTRVLAITSGKGGVGKTNFATNLSIFLSSLGKQVVLFDGDLGLSNVNILLKVIPKYNLIDVMRKNKQMTEVLTDSGYGFHLISGSPGYSGLADISHKTMRYFIDEMMLLSFANFIIIDTSAGIGSDVTSFLTASNDIIIITTPEPTALADAFGIIKVLSTENDIRDIQVHFVVNKASSFQEGKDVASRISQACHNILGLKINYLGCILNDSIVAKSVMHQVPFLHFAPHSKASSNLKAIGNRLINRDDNRSRGLVRFLQKMISSSGSST